jgi:hypothetical protein
MRFRYLKDPLFVFCVILYFVNRWLLKPYLPNSFSRDSLNDVICIPFWVPIMLFLMKKTHLRKEDGPPTASEILIPLIMWSWVFEAYLPFTPFFRRMATSDYMDIFSYTVGACFAAVLWKLWYKEWSPVKRIMALRKRAIKPGYNEAHQPAHKTLG